MKQIFFIAFTISIFIACNKKTDDTPGNPVSPISKIKTEASGATITNYTYDGQGRVVTINNSDGSKCEYEYAGAVITQKRYNTAGVYQYSYIQELNGDGQSIRTTRSDLPGYEELRIYNADKTLAKEISKVNGNTSVFDYFYNDNNLDSIRITNGNGKWQSTIVKTYYTDKPNVLSYAYFGEDIYGKNSKNMQKTEVYQYSDGSSNTPINWTYEYNGQGRVTKKTAAHGNNISITLYTYY